MNRDYRNLIEEDAETARALHEKVHETFERQRKGEISPSEWKAACKAFHSYASPLDEYFEHACEAENYDDGDLREFVLCFLELNPWFFRSGYLKQIFLTKLKRTNLTGKDATRIRGFLIDAVNRRGTREYKYYCRLAVLVTNDLLVKQLSELSKDSDPKRKHRAAMMLEYIEKHGDAPLN